MKSIIFFLVFCPFLAIGQCDSLIQGILSTEVHGDTVIIKNDTVHRNCGSNYSMEISSINNDTIIWMQNNIGSTANCMCNFNLSVTIDSLKPGNYVALVYCSDLIFDTCFIGSVSFTITSPILYLLMSAYNS